MPKILYGDIDVELNGNYVRGWFRIIIVCMGIA